VKKGKKWQKNTQCSTREKTSKRRAKIAHEAWRVKKGSGDDAARNCT
jgi:hypothetical protein